MLPSDLHLVRRLYEAGLPLLLLLVAARSWRARGASVTLREIVFGFVVSQSVELLAVGLGRYRYPDWVLYFPPWPAWVPLGVGLGWAALLPVVMRVSEGILGRGATMGRLALLDGALAVGLDLVLDPAVSGEPLAMWVWEGEGMTPYRFWVLGVPVFNFVGWFVLVAACSLELRVVEARAPGRAGWAWLAALVTADLAVAAMLVALPCW